MPGEAFTRREMAAVVVIAIVAGCVPALQPMLLNGLLAEGRIDAAAIGQAATSEALGMAVAATLASAWFRPRHLRAIGAGAILAVLAANLLTMSLPSPGIIAARGLSGLGNGVLLWILVGMMTRSAVPARLFAIYVTAQASLGFVLSLALATFAIARFGVLSGYGALIAMNALLLVIVRLVPAAYADLGQDAGGIAAGRLPPRRGLLALGAIVINLAGIMAFWIYSVPLGVQAGLSQATMQLVIGAANGAQILAGLSAIALATRLTGLQAVTITAVVGAGTVAMTMAGGAPLVWYPALFVFVFCWMFGPCFHIPFLLTADPSGRSAMFVSTAQLGGMAIGPLLASALTSAGDYGAVRWIALACFAVVLAIAAAFRAAPANAH